MDRAPFSDLDSLDHDTLLARFIAQQEKLDSLIADRDAEVRRLKPNSIHIDRHSPNRLMSCAPAVSGSNI
jgi:hypothetical protein